MMNDEIQNGETQTEEIQTGAVAQEPEQETHAEEPAAEAPEQPETPVERAEPAAAGKAAKEGRGRRKVRVGRVVSDKMDKTVVVAVQRNMRHPLYGKIVRRTKKYKAHDERNDCHVGDMVEIVETRPLSREKRWRVRAIVERAK